MQPTKSMRMHPAIGTGVNYIIGWNGPMYGGAGFVAQPLLGHGGGMVGFQAQCHIS